MENGSAADKEKSMQWQKIEGDGVEEIFRARVPGGWLIKIIHSFVETSVALTFYPDPSHVWDGR
jgi:hypothetical protein